MYKFFIKRLLDIVISFMLLPFVILIIIAISPILLLNDRGPVFYISKRLGKNGKPFNMIKLRSMKKNSEDIRNSDLSTYNSNDDPRLTKVGKFIRKTSIDELPQIINVILGNMSIVGPRPDLPEAIHIYDDNEKRKLEVRPGITGYSQAYFRNSVSTKDKLKNDVYYVSKMSFVLDIKIMFITFIGVIKKKNIYKGENK